MEPCSLQVEIMEAAVINSDISHRGLVRSCLRQLRRSARMPRTSTGASLRSGSKEGTVAFQKLPRIPGASPPRLTARALAPGRSSSRRGRRSSGSRCSSPGRHGPGPGPGRRSPCSRRTGSVLLLVPAAVGASAPLPLAALLVRHRAGLRALLDLYERPRRDTSVDSISAAAPAALCAAVAAE